MAKSDDHHFRLRVPAELKARIEDAASKSGRSINAEILFRLSDTFEDQMFGVAMEMHKTMSVQGKVLEEQAKTIELQADTLQTLHSKILEMEAAAEARQVIDTSSGKEDLQDAIEKLSADMKNMGRSIALFGFAIDEASRGDSEVLDRLIESAKSDPLPKGARREEAEKKDPLLPRKK